MKISAILLAAGRSRRAGGLKPLIRRDGVSFLEKTYSSLLGAECFSEVVVVTGAGAEALSPDLDRLQAKSVFNDDFERGMHSSIRRGLIELSPGWDAVLIALVDQPQFDPGDYRRLVMEFQKAGKGLGRPTFDRELGNPAIIARQYLGEILREPDADRGCAYLFSRHPKDTVLIEMHDRKCLVDFDTPESLAQFGVGFQLAAE